MSQPELDWVVDDAPDEAQAAPEGLAVAGPPRRRPRRLDPRALRRWLAAGAALLLVALLAAWVVTRLGWQRLEGQVTAEVLYEAEHAAAGESGLALTVWAETGEEIHAYRQLHTALAEAGLSAPLPAAHLTPLAGLPTVQDVTLLADGLFAAQVDRGYRDSDGQVVTFTLAQRYRNLGGGLWERVPPDLAPLAATTLVQFNHISATVLVDDLPWLADSLLAADVALEQACREWGDACPETRRLNIIFTADAQYLLTPILPEAGTGDGLGPYPAAFAVHRATPALNQPLRLPSLALTGAPADEAAQAALTRALTAHGLAYFAQAISGTNVRPDDYFFDALVGRAEQRLGLAAPITYSLRPQDFAPLDGLWRAADRQDTVATPGALPYRLQVLKFLDQALAGLPPEADGALLADLRRADDLFDWLDEALGRGGGRRAEAAWRRAAEAALALGNGLSADRLEGLIYSCGDQGYRMRAGQAEPLAFVIPPSGFGMMQVAALSLDGRYLATIDDLGASVIVIDDLESDWSRRMELSHGVYLVGWSAGGALIYIEQDDPESSPGGELGHAMRLDPLTGERAPLTENPVIPMFLPDNPWLPDHTGVVLGLWYPNLGDPGPLTSAPALVPVDAIGESRRLAESGYGAVVSPDGRRVAYAVASATGGGGWNLLSVAVTDLQTGVQIEVLRAASLAEADGATPEYLFPMAWSPVGVELIVLAGGSSVPTRLVAAPLDGGPLRTLVEGGSNAFMYPVGIGAEGRTLAVLQYGPVTEGANLLLADLAGANGRPATTVTLARDVLGAAWSPDGALLAMAGAAGVRVVEPATGQWRWVALDYCSGVQWE